MSEKNTPSAPSEGEIELEPCPFCGAALIVRQHSSFHPDNDCWLATAGEHGSYELDEHDYPAWNRRAQSRRPPDGVVEMVFGDLFHECSEDWVADSYRWRGVPMLGEHAHWCPDWDYLPIDENSFEWPCPCEVGDKGRTTAAPTVPDGEHMEGCRTVLCDDNPGAPAAPTGEGMGCDEDRSGAQVPRPIEPWPPHRLAPRICITEGPCKKDIACQHFCEEKVQPRPIHHDCVDCPYIGGCASCPHREMKREASTAPPVSSGAERERLRDVLRRYIEPNSHGVVDGERLAEALDDVLAAISPSGKPSREG